MRRSDLLAVAHEVGDPRGALDPVADLAGAAVAGGIGNIVAVGGAAAVLVQFGVSAIGQAVGNVSLHGHAIEPQRLAVEAGAEIGRVEVDVACVRRAAALGDPVRARQAGEAVHRPEVESGDALGIVASGQVLRAGHPAGAAVLGIGLEVGLAAVLRVIVAVDESGVALQRAHALRAGGDGVVVLAGLAAPTAVGEVGVELRLAAIVGVVVAVTEALNAVAAAAAGGALR